MAWIWILIFIVSLLVLVKSADWFVDSAEKIGLALNISPFIIGVIIVAVGTSFPELLSALFAVFKGASEIVAANVVGSNIANILLIVGMSSVVARQLIVKRSLIDLDSPLLATTTALFLFIIWDGVIVWGEGVLLLMGFVIYLFYTLFQRREEEDEEIEILPARPERRRNAFPKHKGEGEMSVRVFTFLILGVLGLALGANYTIESVIRISDILGIATSLIAITAVAIGTSLPELVVSVKAAMNHKYEIALGNVFGSNVFNILLIAGIPSLIKPLAVDNLTLSIGVPFLIIATALFIVSGISKRIHIWEGLTYLLIYILFLAKLTGIF